MVDLTEPGAIVPRSLDKRAITKTNHTDGILTGVPEGPTGTSSLDDPTQVLRDARTVRQPTC